MLIVNDKELEILYEGIKELLRKKSEYPDVDLQELQTRILRSGRVDSDEEETYESLNEEFQPLDKVKYKNQKGFITGEFEGKFIVMIQGNTYMVDPKYLKEYNKKAELIVTPHMKFDDKTQKLLFEQYVRCGIYHGNMPIKMNDCFVRYDHWEHATPDQQIKVLVEGNNTFMPKSQVKILEDLNDFANPDNYVPGVIIDETTEEALEKVLINAIDYTNAIGDADEVQIIRQEDPNGSQEIQSLPKSCLRTLSV
jgi:hypothetical protein